MKRARIPGKSRPARATHRPRIVRWLAALPAIAFGCVIYSYLTLPDVRLLATTNPTTTAFMEIRDREAAAAGKPHTRVQRWMAYRRISPNLTRAVLVAEDAAFWEHDGVDYDELQKSIELDWARGQLLRGASTITQQLAKNLYLSPSRNPLRKFRELIIARRLEAELTKARILELYLNVIEWGDNIYGADAAAHAYFGSSAAALAPSQAALLAGAIVNPRLLTPAHPTARLLRRQQIILRRMGGVTPPHEEMASAPVERTPAAVEPASAPVESPLPSPDLNDSRPVEPIAPPELPK